MRGYGASTGTRGQTVRHEGSLRTQHDHIIHYGFCLATQLILCLLRPQVRRDLDLGVAGESFAWPRRRDGLHLRVVRGEWG